MTPPAQRTLAPFGTILHPTDFSQFSDSAFRVAAALARDQGAKLILAHVLNPADKSQLDTALSKLRQMQVGNPLVEVEHRVEVGDAAKAIVDVAARRTCDLIVMGSHGRTGMNRLLLGSVAEEVVRTAPCPVFTVKTPEQCAKANENALLTIRTILYATDFSAPSAQAFPVACALARDYGGRLVVLHVALPKSALAYREMVLRGELSGDDEAIRKELCVIRPPDSATPVEHRLTDGDAAQEILRLAKEVHADIVVMGTHGRTGVGRLMGSVAEKVVRESPCPALTFKSK